METKLIGFGALSLSSMQCLEAIEQISMCSYYNSTKTKKKYLQSLL